MAKIVVVDDERSMREFLEVLLERDGHDVKSASNVASALAVCEKHEPALVFTDLRMPDGTGLDVLRFVIERCPGTQVVIMTAYATAENAVEAMRMGAYDYQIKPVKVDETRAVTQKALEKYNLITQNKLLTQQLQSRFGLSRIIGRGPAMTLVADLVEKVAPTKANVLVEGESGTGKELVARAIHDASPRRLGPFIAVNCGAIPEMLIEAELFGHAAGAFTGAGKARAGLFEAASQGTLLLDEIGELPQSMQVKLLRVIQERLARRVGEEQERAVDVRIVACTNRDLARLVEQKQFREDLFYRLNVVKIRVPPLRERSEDIPLLARSFVLKYGAQMEREGTTISDAAMAALCAYRFPGNVRELENYIERALTLCQGRVIELSDLPSEVQGHDPSNADYVPIPATGIDLEALLTRLERRYIDEALRKSGGVKKNAASLLGLTFRSFRYRLQKLGLEAEGETE